MEKVVKLPQDTLQNIKNLQQQYIQAIHQIGEIEVGVKNLQEAKENLLNQYKKLKIDEKNIIDEIGKQYGYGKLDLEKGELTINIDETEQKQ